MNHLPLITLLTFLPILSGIIIAAWPAPQKKVVLGLSLGSFVLCLSLVVVLWTLFNPLEGGIQFMERHAWIPSLGVEYHVGVDGLGMIMVILTALLGLFAFGASWLFGTESKGYYSLFLLLQGGLFGTFTALNFFHWFIFWELSLVPAFFLIKLWGGPQRSHAATQFFVYTMAGSIALLLSFQAIFLATGSFDFISLAEKGRSGELVQALSARLGWKDLTSQQLAGVIAFGIFLGLAVKVPLAPFHTWLPDAYSQAPTGVTMILTGAMSKMGVYGFLRILLPLFPQQVHLALTPLLWLSVFTILYSAWIALAQTDLKRLLGYSSINHLGYCMLGLFAAMSQSPGEVAKAAALNGVILQMFNHGLSAAALFCFVGLMEKRSGGLRELNEFGGLRKVAPVFCGLMGIALFSSLGLPGLNGFVGEYLIFQGVFNLAGWAAALSVLGLLLTAVFLLILLQRVFHGPLNPKWQQWPDLTPLERWVVAPVIGLMFLLGIYPQLAIQIFNPTVVSLLVRLGV